MSGRKRRARCMKTTTRGASDLNGWLTSPMGCCCRAEGHVDSRANERTNRPPSAAVARSNRGWHSRYVGFHGSLPRRTHNTPRVMGLRPRPPDDARCIRPPFPPSSIRAAQPAIWSETWYGPGTQLANRWSGCVFLRGDGSCHSPNRSPPIGITIGYLDPSPLWGLVVAWFPGFPGPGNPSWQWDSYRQILSCRNLLTKRVPPDAGTAPASFARI